MRQLEAWWRYASLCAQLPGTPACDSFWNAVAILVAVVVALIALYIIRRVVRNLLSVRAENARLAEQKRVADEDTLAQYKADVDKQYALPAGENVEEKIRRALKDRKAEDWGKPGASRRPTDPEQNS